MDNSDDLYRRLIAPIEDKMISLISRIVQEPHDAADAFQEVLACVWSKLARIDRHPNPHAYILRMCMSKSWDALRRRQRTVNSPKDDREDPSPGPVERFSQGETAAEVQKAVSLLPKQQGFVVLLRAVHDCDFRTIGEIVECSEATARSHYSKGRARLKRMLDRSRQTARTRGNQSNSSYEE
jgi:RNA polymerase sigma factor (sigma-70 family)